MLANVASKIRRSTRDVMRSGGRVNARGILCNALDEDDNDDDVEEDAAALLEGKTEARAVTWVRMRLALAP